MRNTNRGETWFDILGFLFVLVVVFCVGIAIGLAAGEGNMRKAAIGANAAEWRVDKYGNTSFHWKTKKGEQTP